MTDESSTPDPEAPKVKRSIKIGSQRPGYVPDTPNKKEKNVVPVVPKPVHKQQPDRTAHGQSADSVAPETSVPDGPTPNSPIPSSPAPESPAPAPAEPVAAAEPAATAAPAPEPVAAPAVEAPVPTDATPTPVPVPAAEDEPAVELPSGMPDIELDMSDEDLEKEIALAMGESVEDLMDGQVKTKSADVEIDERYQATALKIYRESVLFELPGQHNGMIPLKQFEEPPEPGTVVEVVVVGFSNVEQMYELVVPGASVAVVDWSDVQEGVVVEVKITGHNKGGLECEVNRIRGFIPASQISIARVTDFEEYVDKSLQCVVTEASEERRNLVLSHRAIMEREREAAREKLLAELAVGQTREGTVMRLEKFGAFVDIGGIDGLIHISQLSWDNIRHPEEVVSVGQKVKVRVERIDDTTGKIGLSYRDLSHHPWEGIESKYPVGDVVTGTVSKIMDFGAFVKLEPGVEGLVHISELSHKRVNRVSHVVEEGGRVDVKVLTIDADAQRISLSMKQAAGGPEGGSDDAEDDTPIEQYVPKVPAKSLKGGIERPSGGSQFGLNW